MRLKIRKRLAIAAGLGCTLLGLLAPTAFANGPGTWQSRADLPAGVEGPSTANVGNLIVAAYGFGPAGDSNETRIYNIAQDAWSLGSPAPGPAGSRRG